MTPKRFIMPSFPVISAQPRPGSWAAQGSSLGSGTSPALPEGKEAAQSSENLPEPPDHMCSTSPPHRKPQGCTDPRNFCHSAEMGVGHDGHCRLASLFPWGHFHGASGILAGLPRVWEGWPCSLLNTDTAVPAWPKIPFAQEFSDPPDWYPSIAGIPLQLCLDAAAHLKSHSSAFFFRAFSSPIYTADTLGLLCPCSHHQVASGCESGILTSALLQPPQQDEEVCGHLLWRAGNYMLVKPICAPEGRQSLSSY